MYEKINAERLISRVARKIIAEDAVMDIDGQFECFLRIVQ